MPEGATRAGRNEQGTTARMAMLRVRIMYIMVIDGCTCSGLPALPAALMARSRPAPKLKFFRAWEHTQMKNGILAVVALATTLPAWGVDAPAAGTPAQPTPEQIISDFRKDLEAKSADVMAKALTLTADQRSEEHTSELQSQSNLVCRLLLE